MYNHWAYFLFFLFGHTQHSMQNFPHQGCNAHPLQWRAWGPNHWTTREVLGLLLNEDPSPQRSSENVLHWGCIWGWRNASVVKTILTQPFFQAGWCLCEQISLGICGLRERVVASQLRLALSLLYWAWMWCWQYSQSFCEERAAVSTLGQ